MNGWCWHVPCPLNGSPMPNAQCMVANASVMYCVYYGRCGLYRGEQSTFFTTAPDLRRFTAVFHLPCGLRFKFPI